MQPDVPQRILSSAKIEIKPYFKEQYQKILGPRYDEFMDYSFRYIRKCIRVNTLKTTVPLLRERLESQGWILTPVPWCPEGFFIEGHKDLHRFDVGNLVEHNVGYFYVQEAASMLPPVVLFSDVRSKDLTAERQNPDLQETVNQNPDSQFRSLTTDKPYAVLDLCAAPGSKTSQIAQYMQNKGLLIANDVDVSRLRPLALNLQRMGITNALVTLNAFQKSKQSTKFRNPFGEEPFFDKILVDAPCSGTGTIRRSFKMLEMYSAGFVRRLVAIQQALITNAFTMLKSGGVMVYSTCSQEPAENEGVVSFLLEKFPNAELLDIELSIVRSEPIMEFDGQVMHPAVKKCLRIYPQDNNSEGFFVAKIRKH